jgi:hypothetical protein
MRQERDRARAGEDAWKAQCEAVTRQIALPAPAQTAQQPPDTQPSRFRRDGRWMRATGCLVGAGLLLALSTVSAGAQQQQPHQQPPPGMLHGADEPQHAGQSSGLNSARPLHRQDVAVALHTERHRRLCLWMDTHTGCDRARRWTVVQGIERRLARRTAPSPSREATVGSGAGSQAGEDGGASSWSPG